MRVKRPNSGYTLETFKKYIGSPRCRAERKSKLKHRGTTCDRNEEQKWYPYVLV